ncbi:MAG TPA: molybdopterin-dependent oxidoreductase, partial [Citricoccus sp.]
MTLTLTPGAPGTQPGQTDTSVTVSGAPFPTNRGRLCRKGATAAALLGRHPDRLTTPLVRDGSGLRAAGWEEALDLVATRITALQAAHGADAIGVFGSGSLTNEKAYTLGKFARTALRTS